ncbi:unnamed protein product, partial [Ectocarpus sp. 12 AP-2014]
PAQPWWPLFHNSTRWCGGRAFDPRCLPASLARQIVYTTTAAVFCGCGSGGSGLLGSAFVLCFDRVLKVFLCVFRCRWWRSCVSPLASVACRRRQSLVGPV